jgi:isopentenyl diphosphate isomerase/L-lactate dehydrogenase-like FMN-dependent dehydrogenase
MAASPWVAGPFFSSRFSCTTSSRFGARAVCVGRPYVWGLAAFGQPGVEAVLDILRRELVTILRQTGTVTLAEISRQSVVDRGR